MSEDLEIYKNTIKRNLYELAHALLELKALMRLDEYTNRNRILLKTNKTVSI